MSRSPVGAAIITLFAWLWRGIRWFWGAVLLALVIDFFKALLSTGVKGATDPRTWTLTGQALAHPWLSGGIALLAALLTFGAYRADRSKRQSAETAKREAQRRQEQAECERRARPFVLKPVEQLDPHTEPYIHQYVKDAYVSREADNEARTALRAAINRTGGSPLGICILGRPTLGKTRLAFETMRAELAGWTFVKWPHTTRPEDFDFAAQQGKKLVLWLDDLQKYATNPIDALILDDLPRRFDEIIDSLIIIATCRDGEDEVRTRKELRSLVERLTSIRPADISQEQADQIEQKLKKLGVEVQRDKFDGTPGSVILGVERMRDERYPALPENAKRILRTMKLLIWSDVYSFPTGRVRTAAVDIFGLEVSQWRDARDALLRAGFVQLGERKNASEPDIIPVADVYLEHAVPDYPAPDADYIDDFPLLEHTLIRCQDAEALIHLGITFAIVPYGDISANKQHAQMCFRVASEVYTRESEPAEWAKAQHNLGIALKEEAELAKEEEQGSLLEQALNALLSALQIWTKESTPAEWASAHYILGNIFYQQTKQESTETGQKRLLERAVTSYRAALEVYTAKDNPNLWLETQRDLGFALREQAGLTEGKAGKTLSEQALAALHAVLEIATITGFEHDEQTAIEYDLAETIMHFISLAEEEEQKNLLKQAAKFYRSALKVYTREDEPQIWAQIQNNLGAVAWLQLPLAVDETEYRWLLEQALIAYQSAAEIFTIKASPGVWAAIQINLAQIQRYHAALEKLEETRYQALKEAQACVERALTVFTHDAFPLDHHSTLELHKNIEKSLRVSKRGATNTRKASPKKRK